MRMRPPVSLLVAAVLAAGCGAAKVVKTTETVPVQTGTAASAPAGSPIRVGLVTDVGGLSDRSFNHLAYAGLRRAEAQLGIEGRVIQSRAAGDYVSNLAQLARSRYDLVVAVGFRMEGAVGTVARRFPDVHFAIVDDSYASKGIGGAKNVQGLLFDEQQAGYLVGYLAGLLELQEPSSKQTIGSVGGRKIARVDRYVAGFQAGAKAADPGIRTLSAYSQDFVDQARCKEAALNQIAQGSDAEFQVAGQCGLGALDAAREKNVWGIGVDADQSYLGPHILASALKKVDVAVFKTIEQAQDGSFRGGEDTTFGAVSGGIGIGTISPRVPADVVNKVKAVEQQLAAGHLADIPDTVP